MEEEFFEPLLGKIRSRDMGMSKRYSHMVLAAINRAGGRKGSKKFTGKRLGRGGAIGAVLASRDQYSAFRQRRVIVKARIVKLYGRGFDRAQAHMRYVQREGVTREGERGELYNAEHDNVDSKEFMKRSAKDRHQFRFIVAAEDAAEYDELKSLTRRLMSQMEEDLGTTLEWVAVDHFNTGHPHTHIIVRGKDDKKKDLIMSPTYISEGIRERASELVRIDLGPRTDDDIRNQLRSEMGEESFTNLDRRLLRIADSEGILTPFDKDGFRQTMIMGRLKHLERLGLAQELRAGQWQLDDDLENTLRRMGEKRDIIKTMHREMAENNIVHVPSDYIIHDHRDIDASASTKPITGRVVTRGLSDELHDRYYLIVDGADGRAHYIDIGYGEATDTIPEGSIVRVTPKLTAPRKVDENIIEVAAANNGRYNMDLHLNHEYRATSDYVETHLRRLEAIRKTTGKLTREPNGTWIISPDHMNHVVEYERSQARKAPVTIERLSTLTIEQQVNTDGATWLDKELVSNKPETTATSGFGKEIREAMKRRQQWLIEQGFASGEQDNITYKTNLLATLQSRELNRMAGQLSDQLGLSYLEAYTGERIEGTLRGTVELASSKYAIIDKGRDFTLVPWRPVLDHHIGKQISGTMSPDGISWTIGRQRGLGI